MSGDRSTEGTINLSLLTNQKISIDFSEMPLGSLPRVVGETLGQGERSPELGYALRIEDSLVADQNPLWWVGEWARDDTRYVPAHLVSDLLELTAPYGLVSLGMERYGCRAIKPGNVTKFRFQLLINKILG